MNYKLLGKSGLRVSELCLGTMTFGEEWGWGASVEECRKMYDAFVKEGGNFIDTANRYTEGTSEKIIGDLICHDRENIVLATKYSLKMKQGDPNWSGNHRKNMVQSLHHSLKRLKTDYIDLYYIHAWDFTTGVDEVLRSLDDAVRQGKILHIGISDTPAWIVSQMNTIAELRGWSSFSGLQVEYSLVERTPERELLPMARAFDMAVLPWSPLGAGVLTGKFSGGKHQEKTRIKEGSRRLSERNMKIADAVAAVASELNVSPAQIALAWLLHQPGVNIPIIGGRNESQIKDNLNSVKVKLTADHLKRLNDVSAIELGFPYEFLNANNTKDLLFGGTVEKIKNHRVK
ncbi:MAG: aldo/keto reductase [Bacteroidota bacterium]|jgi:aryl-alcohol dehydrogenase-like predicted oxidoreductase